MTESPKLFASLFCPRRSVREFAWAAVGALALHGALLTLLLKIPAREPVPPPSAPAPLRVTLLDAPQVGARRSEGLAGGGATVVLGVIKMTSDSWDHGSADAPTGTGVAKGTARERQQTARGAPDLRRPPPSALAAAPKERAQRPKTPRPKPGASATESPPPSTGAAQAALATGSPVQGAGGTGTGGGSTHEGFGEGHGRGLSLDPVSGDTTVLQFGDGMQHPRLVSKVDPVWTKEARDARVQGSILAKCVITTAGRLRDCQIIKGIPMMDEQVLSALRQWRYEPVVYRQRPVSVRYLIPIRLQ